MSDLVGNQIVGFLMTWLNCYPVLFSSPGKIGDWKSHLDADLNTKMNRMITGRFRDTGLIFDYHPSETDQDFNDSNNDS